MLRGLSAALAAATLVATLASAADAPRATPTEARDAAWRLAMLAERAGKLHVQSGLGIAAPRARKALAESVAQIDVLVRDAPARAPGAEARDSALLLRLLWHEYRPWLLRAPTRENARRMAERTEEVAWVALKTARLGEAQDEPAAQAARGAVLSQRAARLLLLRRWDVRDEAASRELASAERELAAILERLATLAAGRADVLAELDLARNQQGFMEQAARELAVRPGSTHAAEVAAKTGDTVAESLQRAARLLRAQPLSASPR